MKMMHDGWRRASLEQLADARRADAGVHLDEIGAARKEKRHLGFAGHRTGEQRLAGTRRSDEKDALGNAPANRRKLRRLTEKVDDFLDFFLRLVDAGDVGEGDAGGNGFGLAGLALERRDAARGHAEHRESDNDQDTDAQQHRPICDDRRGRRRTEIDAHALACQTRRHARIQRQVVRGRQRPHALAREALYLEHVTFNGER